MKRVRVTLVPLVVAAAAFFVVLPRSGGDATISMVGSSGSYAYRPDRLELAEGARVLVENTTDTTHTITAVAGTFELTIQPGDSRFLEVAAPGAYDYYCRFHGASDGMTGTLTLGDASAPVATPSPVATS